MTRVAATITMLLACCAALHAQGALQWSAGLDPGVAPGSGDGVMFELTALQTVSIHRIGIRFANVGEVTGLGVWYRHGGFDGDSGWVQAGTLASFASQANGEVYQLPIDIAQVAPAWESFAIAVIRESGPRIEYQPWPKAGDSGHFLVNADAHALDATPGTPPWEPADQAERGFLGAIWYDEGGPRLSVTEVTADAVNVPFDHAEAVQAAAFTVAEVNGLPGARLEAVRITPHGSGQADTAFAEVALYRGAGDAFDPDNDTLLDVHDGFTSGGGLWFELPGYEQEFGPGQERKYFLVVTLSGQAAKGDAFDFQVSDLAVSGGGETAGVPGAVMPGLVIDAVVLTVAAAAEQPEPVVHSGGNTAAYVVAHWELDAEDGDAAVGGLALNGSGDWGTVEGVRVFLDDGSGVFDPDGTLLFEGSGADEVHADFTDWLVVPDGDSRRLWLVIALTEEAGIGEAAGPVWYQLGLAGVSVAAGAQAVIPDPSPQSTPLGAIEFFVSEFSPLSDHTDGGAPITIVGSGLMYPLAVWINGVACAGTPMIQNGTIATGLLVPEATAAGGGVLIEIQSGALTRHTYHQTFAYSGGPRREGGGCVVGRGGLALWIFCVMLAIRRRTKRVSYA